MQTDVISGTDARCLRTQSRWPRSCSIGLVPGPPGWISTSSGRGVVDRVVRAEHQGLGADDGLTVGREAEGVPAVLGVLLGPVGEHLPGADGVQLLDPVEEEEPDLAALVRSAVGWCG